jgi:hypothetical protein
MKHASHWINDEELNSALIEHCIKAYSIRKRHNPNHLTVWTERPTSDRMIADPDFQKYVVNTVKNNAEFSILYITRRGAEPLIYHTSSTTRQDQ